jgi:hypothetical protein
MSLTTLNQSKIKSTVKSTVKQSKIKLWVGAIALAGVAYAATTSLNLVINGEVSSAKAIVVNNQTYVPISALKNLGIVVSSKGNTVSLSSAKVSVPSSDSGNSGAGGANQKNSVEGCLGEQLFNGIWRLRVAKLEAFVDGSQNGYDLTLELRNGVSKTITAVNTGISPSDDGKNLVLADGQTLAFSNDTASNWVDTAFKSIPQGALNKAVLRYYMPEGTTEKPVKFLFEIDASKLDKDLKLSYTVKDPSFRVNLTCQK